MERKIKKKYVTYYLRNLLSKRDVKKNWSKLPETQINKKNYFGILNYENNIFIIFIFFIIRF